MLPNHTAIPNQQLSNGVKTGIVEHDCLGRQSDGVRSTIQTAGVAAAYVAIRNVMSTAGDPQTDTFYVQLRIAKGDVYESGTVTGHLCLAHNGHGAMPGKSRFQNESVFRRQSGSTQQNGSRAAAMAALAGCSGFTRRAIASGSITISPPANATEEVRVLLPEPFGPATTVRSGTFSELVRAVREQLQGELHEAAQV
jgi:hypothetical protein